MGLGMGSASSPCFSSGYRRFRTHPFYYFNFFLWCGSSVEPHHHMRNHKVNQRCHRMHSNSRDRQRSNLGVSYTALPLHRVDTLQDRFAETPSRTDRSSVDTHILLHTELVVLGPVRNPKSNQGRSDTRARIGWRSQRAAHMLMRTKKVSKRRSR